MQDKDGCRRHPSQAGIRSNSVAGKKQPFRLSQAQVQCGLHKYRCKRDVVVNGIGNSVLNFKRIFGTKD